MATINNLVISFPDFKLNDTIDPEQHDTNNAQIVSKLNEVAGVVTGFIDSTTVGQTGSEKLGSPPIDGVSGSKVYNQLVSLKGLSDTLESNKANKVDVYTKIELQPYLQGGDTIIRYDVYTIVNSNNGDGTFTYKDTSDVEYDGIITAEGYQTFDLHSGLYVLNENRIEAIINDTMNRSVASGGLREETTTSVTLTIPEGNGAEITFKFFERVGLMGEHALTHDIGGGDELPTLRKLLYRQYMGGV